MLKSLKSKIFCCVFAFIALILAIIPFYNVSSVSANEDSSNLVLDTFIPNTFTGIDCPFYGDCVWSDGSNYYYNYVGSNDTVYSYKLDIISKTWQPFTFTGIGSFYGNDVFVWKDVIYATRTISSSYFLYSLNTSTNTWSHVTNIFQGPGRDTYIIGDSLYLSDGPNHFRYLNPTTGIPVTFVGLESFSGRSVLNINNNYYISQPDSVLGPGYCYKLDVDSLTWQPFTFGGLEFFYSVQVWSDGSNYYCNYVGSDDTVYSYILDLNTMTWLNHSWYSFGGSFNIEYGARVFKILDMYYYDNFSIISYSYYSIYNSGYTQGYTDGITQGREEGFNEGYNQGYQDITEEVLGYGIFMYSNLVVTAEKSSNEFVTLPFGGSFDSSKFDVFNGGIILKSSFAREVESYCTDNSIYGSVEFNFKFDSSIPISRYRSFIPYKADYLGPYFEFYLDNGKKLTFSTGDDYFSFIDLSSYVGSSITNIILGAPSTDDLYTLGISANNVDSSLYNQGFNDGKNSVDLKPTYNQGFNNGYNQGLNDGKLNANNYSFLGLLTAVVDAPLTIFNSMFDYTILGINLKSLIVSIFTLLIIVIILRMALGR